MQAQSPHPWNLPFHKLAKLDGVDLFSSGSGKRDVYLQFNGVGRIYYWREISYDALLRNNFKCAECGKTRADMMKYIKANLSNPKINAEYPTKTPKKIIQKMLRTMDIVVHHIKLVSEGGMSRPDNLKVVCTACHLGFHKGNMTINQLLNRLKLDEANLNYKNDRT